MIGGAAMSTAAALCYKGRWRAAGRRREQASPRGLNRSRRAGAGSAGEGSGKQARDPILADRCDARTGTGSELVDAAGLMDAPG
jgi:hypothetical protein